MDLDFCSSCNGEIIFENLIPKCGHPVCEKCEKKNLEFCPKCNEKIIFLKKCCICFDNSVDDEDITSCNHSICKDCTKRLNSLHCPFCKTELVSRNFTSEIKEKIEKEIENERKFQEIKYEIELKIASNLNPFIPRMVVYGMFLDFYKNFLENKNEYEKYLNVFIYYFNKRSLKKIEIEYIYSEFMNLFYQNFDSEEEYLNILNGNNENIPNNIFDIFQSINIISPGGSFVVPQEGTYVVQFNSSDSQNNPFVVLGPRIAPLISQIRDLSYRFGDGENENGDDDEDDDDDDDDDDNNEDDDDDNEDDDDDDDDEDDE